MNLVMVGLSHKTAPVEVREQLNFSAENSGKYLEKMSESAEIESGIVLSTCNRVEIYASGSDKDLHQKLKDYIYSFHNLRGTDVDSYFYVKENDEAVRHLFLVASSLDSIIVGEPQILGQVKDAYDISKKFGMIDSFFEQFLQKTFFVAKKIRTDTDIGKMAVSISSMAVELSGKIFESLHGKNALIIGSGEMAELALSSLKRKGIDKAWIANRTFEHAASLAKKFDAFPIYFEQFGDILSHADIVISATGMQNYIIKSEMAVKSLVDRKQLPQLFVDISVPRNIDPEVGNIENAYLYNIDDLQDMVVDNQQARFEAAQKAVSIIEAETSTFNRELGQKKYSPTIQKLKNKFSTLLDNECKKSFSNLAVVQQESIERFKESVLQKFLTSTICFIKNNDEMSDEEKNILIDKIFNLNSEEK